MKLVHVVLGSLYLALGIGCAATPDSSDERVADEASALAGGCRVICPKCKPGEICPKIACFLDCNAAKKVPCGDTSCHNGEVCCNDSCGICTPPDGFCTQQICGPVGETCGDATCAEGDVCCNASCGICTPPGGLCTQQVCEPAPLPQ